MRAVCQRVSAARVTVDGAVRGEIGLGLVVLLGVARGDDAATADRLAGKVARLRIFGDERGKFDRSSGQTTRASPQLQGQGAGPQASVDVRSARSR